MTKSFEIESKPLALLLRALTLLAFVCFFSVATGAKADMTLSPGEAAQVKADLFAIFDQEDKTLFAGLPPARQAKTLAYYAEGRKEQTNKKKLYKGVYNLMAYYRDIVINENALAQYKKTGKLPDGKIPAIGILAEIASKGFPGGPRYVDQNKASQFDTLIIDIAEKEVAEGRKEVAEINKRVAEGRKEVAEGERRVADLKKESARLQKNIDLLQTLLKAL
jgi:hypothetical protein